MLPAGSGWVVGVAHVGHIGLSRLYLGVHSVLDLAGGLAVCSHRPRRPPPPPPPPQGCLLAPDYYRLHQIGLAAALALESGPLSWVDAVSAGAQPTAAAAAVLGCSAALLAYGYPNASPTNTAYLEVVEFGGLHAGACLAASLGAGRAGGAGRAAQPAAVAVEFAVGLVALGVFRCAPSCRRSCVDRRENRNHHTWSSRFSPPVGCCRFGLSWLSKRVGGLLVDGGQVLAPCRKLPTTTFIKVHRCALSEAAPPTAEQLCN